MATNGVTFSVDAAKRIVKVVKRVEQTPESSGGRNPVTIQPGTRFWAYLIAGATWNQYEFKYGFIKVIPDATDERFGWQFDIDVQGVDCVRDPSGRDDLAEGTVAEIEFTGYDADGEPQYWICGVRARQTGNSLPPHNHSDNINGGFAFAVYAPGTSFPQQPFAV